MKNHLHLHFIVLLFGFTAILGKLITIPASDLVLYRMFLAALGMGLFAWWKKIPLALPRKTIIYLLGIGGIVALHWITFFGAVKVSNVSVTLGCMATATLFTSLLEPLIEKRRIYFVEVFIGLIIIGGLYIITQFALDYYLGIIYALISAFLASLFGVLNRQFVQKHHANVISFYEMLAGFVLIAIYLLATGSFHTLPHELIPSDAGYLMILALVCTAYAFVVSVYLLKHLSAFTVSLAINMEPVYGIILAFLIFGESEKMDVGFYIGTLVILVAISVYPMLKKMEMKWIEGRK